MELEELLVNCNVTDSCQANLSPKQKIKRYKKNEPLKNCLAHNFSKISKLQNASIKFVISASFVFSVFFFLLLMLWAFFLCFTQSGGGSQCFNFDKFLDIPPLIFLRKPAAITSYLSRKKTMSSRFCPCYGKNELKISDLKQEGKLWTSFNQKFAQGKACWHMKMVFLFTAVILSLPASQTL